MSHTLFLLCLRTRLFWFGFARFRPNLFGGIAFLSSRFLGRRSVLRRSFRFGLYCFIGGRSFVVISLCGDLGTFGRDWLFGGYFGCNFINCFRFPFLNADLSISGLDDDRGSRFDRLRPDPY